jgi:hypothetical protein
MKSFPAFDTFRLLIILLILGLPGTGLCADSSLEDVFSGFEEEPADSVEMVLDDALSGFEEPPSSDLDSALDGFEEETASSDSDVETDKPSQILPSWVTLSGSLSLAGSLNFSHDSPDPGQTDHRGLSRLKAAGDLTSDLRFSRSWQGRLEVKGFYDLAYDLKGRDEFTSQVLDDYVKELEIGEAWLQGSLLPNLDIKTGRQIVVWGKSDNIRVTDILNPLDNREPGLVDIRDLRLPVTMTKVDYYIGDWNLAGIVIHENRFNKEPVFGNDFYMYHLPAPHHDKPNTAWRNQEFALAVNGIFSGWDISLYGARVFDDMAHLELTATGPVRRHSRIGMAGLAANAAIGSWLFKGEAAWLDGIEYSIPVGEKSRLDLLVGAEYTGINETVLSLEIANRHILAYDDRLEEAPVYVQENETQVVLRASKDFFHDTLTLTGLVSLFVLSDNDGAFERFTAEYELTQNLTLTSGLILYQSGDKAAFRDIGNNDRLFCELRYHF